MTIFDVESDALRGGSAHWDRYRGHPVLVVNVASQTNPPDAGATAAVEKLPLR